MSDCSACLACAAGEHVHSKHGGVPQFVRRAMRRQARATPQVKKFDLSVGCWSTATRPRGSSMDFIFFLDENLRC